ncbi:MAG TPA: hypothetical protein VFA99_14410 [Acidobacteriaceae bacterium]|nr:hypothetical protein [Acidobacteriaceae bacterium]
MQDPIETAARGCGYAVTFLLSTMLISSCNYNSKVWSLELKSPDGKHVAYARSDIYTGPGTDGGQTTVDLNWTEGSQKPVGILTLPDVPRVPQQETVLQMKWLSSTDLELDYSGKEEPLFQAIKCDGVNIVLKKTEKGAAPN